MDAKEIKQIRLRLGLTQKEFGEKIGATGTSTYKWEHGRSKPHPVFVEKIEALSKEIQS